MKKIVFTLIAACTLLTVTAQKRVGGTRGKTGGIHFFLQDFNSGRQLDTAGIGDVLKNKSWYKPAQLTPGIGLSYGKGITPKVDLRGTLSFSFEDYLFKNRIQFGNTDVLTEFDIAGNFKALDDSHIVIPYLTAGIGGSYYRGYLGAIAPVGVGLQWNLFNDVFVDLQSQLRLGLTDNTTNHLYHSLGVVASLPKPEPKPIKVVTPPVVVKKDTDGDGLTDDVDDCPNEKGSASLRGCPDKDNDGIADKNDNCPDKAGVAKYNGCPVPDSDGDGINDDNDKCISTPGLAIYSGCPIPDTDGDGLNDENDNCINEAGPASNKGCPVAEEVKAKIDYVAKNVLFATGSSKLIGNSTKNLNEVVKILNEYADVNLTIEGHTDNTGDAEKNQTLSQNRADAVKAYLISKGINESRLTASGYGQDQPIADNETKEGRQQNRRVELKLGY
jgi:OmpA-OmpF porin, OOP family